MDYLKVVETLRKENSSLRDVLRACFHLLRIASPPLEHPRDWLEKRKLVLHFEAKLPRLAR